MLFASYSLAFAPKVQNIQQMTLEMRHTVSDCWNDTRTKEMSAKLRRLYDSAKKWRINQRDLKLHRLYDSAKKWRIYQRDFEATEDGIIVDI